jgi:hypothetical protein
MGWLAAAVSGGGTNGTRRLSTKKDRTNSSSDHLPWRKTDPSGK